MSEDEKKVFREEENEKYDVPSNASKGANLEGLEAYKKLQEFALSDSDGFWDQVNDS